MVGSFAVVWGDGKYCVMVWGRNVGGEIALLPCRYHSDWGMEYLTWYLT